MAARNRKTTRRSGAASEGRAAVRRAAGDRATESKFLVRGVKRHRRRSADPHASFFELGFDSLFLTQAVLAVQNRFGVRVSFRQLLEDLSSLETLAVFLDRSRPIVEIKPAAKDKPRLAEPVQGFGALAPIDRAHELRANAATESIPG